MYDYTFTPWTIRDGRCVLASESKWKKPLKWDRASLPVARVINALLDCDPFAPYDGPIVNGRGERLLCNATHGIGPWKGMGSYARNATFADVLARVFGLIDSTPNLDWYAFTKWSENVRGKWPKIPFVKDDLCSDDGQTYPLSDWRANIILGVIVDDQPTADARIPALLGCADLCKGLAVRYTGIGEWQIPYSATLDGDATDDCPLSLVEIATEISPEMPPDVLANIRAVIWQCEEAGVKNFQKACADFVMEPD